LQLHKVFIIFHHTACAQFAIFQGSGDEAFSHVTAIFRNMPFRIFILKMYLLKGYTAQKLLKEFPRVGTSSFGRR